MCLIIGPIGVGKTLLLKRLSTFTSTGYVSTASMSDIPTCIPTVGTNLVTIPLQRKHEVTLRELGGCMGPIWRSYYADVSTVIYMIDISNRVQVSSACIQLLEVLTHPDLESKTILILLNKIDLDTRMPPTEFEAIFRLKDIRKFAKPRLSVLELSAVTGQGLPELVKWLQETRK